MNDPVESRNRLRAANPVANEDLPSADSPKAAELFRRITATDPGRQRDRKGWWRRSLWVLVPAALLATAAGYGLLHKVTDPLVVACYPRAALSATIAVVSGDPQDPVAACADLWKAGGALNPQGGAAPALVACELPTGVLGVFPTGNGVDTCATLGLEAADGQAETKNDDRNVFAVQAALSGEFVSRCVGRDEAESLARRELTSHELGAWTVVADTAFTDREPCASLAMDVPGHTIRIVPVSDSS